MRCIETQWQCCAPWNHPRLIETWDVLKQTSDTLLKDYADRLIETWDVLKRWYIKKLEIHTVINRNMRCIETQSRYWPKEKDSGLIETWDVLKPIHECPFKGIGMINRNMRCIETT